MDVFKNTKKSKKFILIILAIMLFSFAIPKQVMAGEWDLRDNISEFLFWIERGIIRVANNIFCDERHEYYYDKERKW